ncbi:hypothetical protein L2E82_01132 [Cichorium intybus]|uniref:Uncharacterized protein n=1 Tax=Cichorium intybus TaxID=13427 RepID=A0ACB9GY15_CICIN|nr:hypothetical protein L2E82_01132 [Cichorium intybus]
MISCRGSSKKGMAGTTYSQFLIIAIIVIPLLQAKKKTAIDNIDAIAEESDEIVRNECLKADLMKKVEAEVIN